MHQEDVTAGQKTLPTFRNSLSDWWNETWPKNLPKDLCVRSLDMAGMMMRQENCALYN